MMPRSFWVVMGKEILDNLRDRQTLFYALLFGPILLPLLLGGSLALTFKQLSIDFDIVTTVPVLHAERAPQLVEFLAGQNIDAVAAPDDPVAAVANGRVDVVLEIGENFGEQLREARPAALILYLDESDKASSRAARRMEAVFGLWEQTNNSLRLQHRGLDPTVFDTLELVRDDVSSNGADGQLLASLLPFLFIVSMTMGGFYLAIDTTAGERERRSLEPLLGLPIARRDIVFGKFGATLAFIVLSVVLCAVAVWGLFRLFPADLIGGDVRFDARTVFTGLLLVLPLAPFIAALLVTVSAWTRSVKEAQTYLGLLMVIPMAPFFVLQYISAKSELVLMPWPMLSQYLLLERSTQGLSFSPLEVGLSVAGTLAASAMFVALACLLYRRERILS